MLQSVSLIILSISLISVSARCCKGDVEGYYWRDFSGEVPKDALEGGKDLTGKPIYIGQVFEKFLIPAKIYENDKKAYYEYGGSEHTVTENIKILCTQYPEKFEWIDTNNDDIKLITDKHLVIGGYEPGCTTYIGRVRTGGEILVGKALTDNAPQFSGLHITRNGKGMRHTTFAVLAFNKDAPKNNGLDASTENAQIPLATYPENVYLFLLTSANLKTLGVPDFIRDVSESSQGTYV